MIYEDTQSRQKEADNNKIYIMTWKLSVHSK